MTDNFTYRRSNYHESGGRWPMGKSTVRKPRMKNRTLDQNDLIEIGRLVGFKTARGIPVTFGYRSRTRRVAQTTVWIQDTKFQAVSRIVETALSGSLYEVLGVSPRFSDGGYPLPSYTVEIVASLGGSR